ncbi:uncharacterized protein LOC143421550 [Maylandia zebra]|uniref:uncharacterized protein LOC143421550 n=1 Tax=Maylandia zebra TaxID=106582 RepID=UPI00403C131F
MRGGGIPRAARTVVSDEIRATIIDHVINHGLSLREAGERVQPNLRRSTVASIIRIFQQTNRMQRLPPSGGRGKLLSNDQELAIVEMVTANNAIKLREIQTRIVADHEIFDNIDRISLTTITRTLSKHRVRMKQLYTVPFERNSERVKELRRQYVQRVMELEANQAPHEFIDIDEAGFNLAKRRRRGRNVIGKRATVDVPGQRGANITMCAAIANAGLLLHRCQVGPYNTERLLAFLNDLHQRLVPEQGQEGENMRTFVITWDNVAFHHSQAITTWFEVHPRLRSYFLHGGGRFMTISHMTRCPSLKPWMLAPGTSQLTIAKGGSDIPGGFIPGASTWMTSDVMLMKTCGLFFFSLIMLLFVVCFLFCFFSPYR